MSFEAIERRVREECEKHGDTEARKLRDSVAKELGYNPDSTWGVDEEFLKAIAPLKMFASRRFAQLKMRETWANASQAALDVVKESMK